MQSKEKQQIKATVSIRVVEPRVVSVARPFEARNEAEESVEPYGGLFEFAGNAPATFAERFPRLMVFATALAFIVAAVAVEIECLHGAGYYWR